MRILLIRDNRLNDNRQRSNKLSSCETLHGCFTAVKQFWSKQAFRFIIHWKSLSSESSGQLKFSWKLSLGRLITSQQELKCSQVDTKRIAQRIFFLKKIARSNRSGACRSNMIPFWHKPENNKLFPTIASPTTTTKNLLPDRSYLLPFVSMGRFPLFPFNCFVKAESTANSYVIAFQLTSILRLIIWRLSSVQIFAFFHFRNSKQIFCFRRLSNCNGNICIADVVQTVCDLEWAQ